jgi:ribosomal protein L37AE/L43A
MALIKCPECTRSGVSDTARACPNCGYDIKEHFIKLRKKEMNLIMERGVCPDCKEMLIVSMGRVKSAQCQKCGRVFSDEVE